MSTAPTAAKPVRVLHSLAPPDATTKYVNQIAEGAPADVHVQFFSWKTALLGDYDLLHVHWPELLLRGRNWPKRLAKRWAMRLLLTRLRRRHRPLVRTLHNVAPHESGSRAEHRLLRRIDAATDLFIRLNPVTRIDRSSPVITILHGHYVDRFAGHPRPEVVPGLVLYFGIIRAYKGVDRLLEVFPDIGDADVRLRIVGSPSPDMRTIIEEATDRDPRITARLAFVPDAELVHEVSSAELVVLPYREMHNSGALLVALSLGRPVLVPRSASNAALAEEVGDNWVIQYDDDLSAAAVRDALATVRSPERTRRPRLEGRDWKALGQQHADAYRTLLTDREPT